MLIVFILPSFRLSGRFGFSRSITQKGAQIAKTDEKIFLNCILNSGPVPGDRERKTPRAEPGLRQDKSMHEQKGEPMNAKDEMLSALRSLAAERRAAALMREDLACIAEDEKRTALPAEQRGALEKEKRMLSDCLAVTEHRTARAERLLALLTPEERQVLEYTVISPRPQAVTELAEALHRERASIYRLRARALEKLVRLRCGAGK